MFAFIQILHILNIIQSKMEHSKIIERLIILTHFVFIASSAFIVDLNNSFLLTQGSLNITTIDQDLNNYFLVGFEDGQARRYSPDFSSFIDLPVPQPVEQFNSWHLEISNIQFSNGTVWSLLSNMTTTLSHSRTILRAYNSTSFDQISSYMFNQPVTDYQSQLIDSPPNSYPVHLLVFNQTIQVIYKGINTNVFDIRNVYQPQTYPSAICLFNSSVTALGDYLNFTYQYMFAVPGQGLLSLTFNLSFLYNFSSLSYDLTIEGHTDTFVAPVNTVERMMMANGVLLMQVSNGELSLMCGSTLGSPFMDSNIGSSPVLKFTYFENTYYILYSKGIVVANFSTNTASFTSSTTLQSSFPNNTYRITQGSIVTVFYTPLSSYIFKMGCSGQYNWIFSTCTSYSCADSNCDSCPLTSNTCGICANGYIRKDTFVCTLNTVVSNKGSSGTTNVILLNDTYVDPTLLTVLNDTTNATSSNTTALINSTNTTNLNKGSDNSTIQNITTATNSTNNTQTNNSSNATVPSTTSAFNSTNTTDSNNTVGNTTSPLNATSPTTNDTTANSSIPNTTAIIITNNSTTTNVTTNSSSNQTVINLSNSTIIANNSMQEDQRPTFATFLSTFQALFNTLFNATQKFVSIPSARQLSPWFYFFGNFDDLYLYMFHDRLYGPTFTELFSQINLIETQKWNALNFAGELSWLSDQNGSLSKQINYQQAYLTYDYAAPNHPDEGSEGLLANCKRFFLVGVPVIIVFFFLFRLLFRSLSRFPLSQMLRKFDLWGFFFIIIFEGNVQQFSFYMTAELKHVFFFSASDCTLKGVIIWFGFVLILISVGSFFLTFGAYQKLNRLLTDLNRNNLKGNCFLLLQLGIRNLLLGVFHSFLRKLEYYAMVSVLLTTQLTFLVAFTVSVGLKIYKKVYSIWIYLLLTFVRILLIFTLLLDYQNEGSEEMQSAQWTLITIMLMVYLLGTMFTVIAISLDLIENVKKISKKSSSNMGSFTQKDKHSKEASTILDHATSKTSQQGGKRNRDCQNAIKRTKIRSVYKLHHQTGHLEYRNNKQALGGLSSTSVK